MKYKKSTVAVMGLLLIFIAINAWALSSSAVIWQAYSEALILESKRLNKPVIINFHADWCLPCIQLRQKTFNHSSFIWAAKDFTMIQVDLTERNDPKQEALIKKYTITGVPTIIFLDKEGDERIDFRVEEFLTLQDFQYRMANLIKMKSQQ